MNDTTRQQQQNPILTPMQPYAMKKGNGTRLTPSQQRTIGYIAAGLCFLSELIHLYLLPAQYETYLLYGIIFLLIAMAQGIIGANLLFEPSRRLLTFGLWINALIIILYGFTHIIGVVVGLGFFLLPVDGWGVAATISELGIIILLLLLPRQK